MTDPAAPHHHDHAYGHGHHESVLRGHRWRTAANSAAFLLPHLRPGDRLLDVGCGPGTITADLADRVPGGRVTGLDADPGVVAAARAGSARADLGWAVADVYALPLADGTVDVVYVHQVLHHLTDPVAALREVRRVTRPGGIVALRETDYGAKVWYPPEPALERWREIFRAVAQRQGTDPDAGRAVHAWARAAGFTDLVTSTSAWTFHSPEDRAWWGGSWADRVEHSAYATNALDAGLTDRAELAAIAAAFRRWADDPDGRFVVVHGEVLARR